MAAHILTVCLILCGLTLVLLLWRELRASQHRLEVIARQVDALAAETAQQRRAQERDEALARAYFDAPSNGRHLRAVPSLGFLSDVWQDHRQRTVLASVVAAGLLAVPSQSPSRIEPTTPNTVPPAAEARTLTDLTTPPAPTSTTSTTVAPIRPPPSPDNSRTPAAVRRSAAPSRTPAPRLSLLADPERCLSVPEPVRRDCLERLSDPVA